jgi:filamentous hemagglutinin family protein
MGVIRHNKSRRWPSLFILLVALHEMVFSMSVADITLDGSLGGPSGPLSGPDYVIRADMGQQVDTNLFHSFGEFNIFNGQSATFTGEGATGAINNVLSRVTGGAASTIDGLLRSTIPGANLFLINPAGLLFLLYWRG